MADGKEHAGEAVDVEVKDRGLFDLLGKKKEHEREEERKEGEKCQEEVPVSEFEKVRVTEEEKPKEEEKKEEEKKEGLLEKLHRSHSSSSSSSSDEEEAAEGEAKGEKKKKKKKGLKEKIQEKISGEKKEGAEEHGEKSEPPPAVVEDNTVPVEKIEELAQPESEAQEKKSLLEKIKGKLPGGGQPKKPAEEAPSAAAESADHVKEHHEGDSPKEKKGFLGKIMDKIPGYHKTNGAEESSTPTPK